VAKPVKQPSGQALLHPCDTHMDFAIGSLSQ
jgi:hypothetical protein